MIASGETYESALTTRDGVLTAWLTFLGAKSGIGAVDMEGIKWVPLRVISKSIILSTISKSSSGELGAELSEYPDREETELMDMFFLLVLADLFNLDSMSGRFFLGLPRFTTFRTTPSKAPMHIPR